MSQGTWARDAPAHVRVEDGGAPRELQKFYLEWWAKADEYEFKRASARAQGGKERPKDPALTQ